MKKFILLFILVLTFCFPLVGCSDNEKEADEPTIVGGWVDVEDGTITQAHTDMFTLALDGVVGVSYTQKKLVAKQVVAGINYKFLCEQKIMAREIIKTEKYVVIYRDLSGNCSILSVEDVEEKQINLAGWTEAQNGTITQAHTDMFNDALSGYTGASFKPIKLVATQIVAGVNYKFLCEETIVGITVTKAQVYVTIYKDLDGNCTITNVE